MPTVRQKTLVNWIFLFSISTPHVSFVNFVRFLLQTESLFPVLFCCDHTSGWHIDIRSTIIYRHKEDQGHNGPSLIFLAGSSVSSVRIRQEKGAPAAGTRKWDATRHRGPHFELSGVWLILCPLTEHSPSLTLLYHRVWGARLRPH